MVFGETATAPFDYGRTTRRAYSAWRAAGLNRITLHECRHSFRTYDYAGLSEIRCDRYLGHSDRSLGARYSHALTTQVAADAAALDAFLDGASSGRVVALSVAAGGAA